MTLIRIYDKFSASRLSKKAGLKRQTSKSLILAYTCFLTENYLAVQNWTAILLFRVWL